MIVGVKSSYTIASQRLPSLVSEPRNDVPKQLFFADASFEVGDINVRDAYLDASVDIKAQDQFRQYYEVQQMLKKKADFKEGKEFWLLARYLDTQMLGQMYKSQPYKDWYIIIKDDSFVFWQTMVRWLQDLDSNQEHYLGRAARLGPLLFAQGGGGYVISKRLMASTYGSAPSYANADPLEYARHSAGDSRLAQALYSGRNVTIRSVTGGYHS
jgi:hypothetical protein